MLPRTLFFTRTSYDLMRKYGKKIPSIAPFWTPKLAPEWVRELLKSGSEFGPVFGSISGSLLGQFWGPLGHKTGPGEVQRDLREPTRAPRSQKDDFQKSGFRIGPSAHFRSWNAPRWPQDAEKRAKVRPEGALKPKKGPQSVAKKKLILGPVLSQFRGPFRDPKSAKKWSEKGPEIVMGQMPYYSLRSLQKEHLQPCF